jgi:hypothetical protein
MHGTRNELNRARRSAAILAMMALGRIALTAAGLGLIAFNAARLVSDWHRMKPRYNVDWAFIQIIAGVILIALAIYLGRTAVE